MTCESRVRNMKITIIGGGPGGLYFAILTKKARPDWDIEVFEQNSPDDTFGFGVVFSDSSLDEYETRDNVVYERMREEFAYWDDSDVHSKGKVMKCRGNGFCVTYRVHLLSIQHDRSPYLGVALNF